MGNDFWTCEMEGCEGEIDADNMIYCLECNNAFCSNCSGDYDIDPICKYCEAENNNTDMN